MGVPEGQIGEGQVTTTAFSVPADSLEYWRARLAGRGGIGPARIEDRFGEPALAVDDPSGLRFELVAGDRDARAPWLGAGIDRRRRDPRAPQRDDDGGRARTPRSELMTELLGFDVVAEADGRMRLAVGGRGPGHTIDLAYGTGARPARNGLGTVHHVAMAAPSGRDAARAPRGAAATRGAR